MKLEPPRWALKKKDLTPDILLLFIRETLLFNWLENHSKD